MNHEPILRDERYYAVENASYRVGYLIMTFGTLVLCTVRAALLQQSNWDFFGLVIIAGLAATVYQIRQKILPYTYKTIILMMGLSIILAAVAGLAVSWIKNALLK